MSFMKRHIPLRLFSIPVQLETKEEKEILVAGPYYGHRGADWNRGLNRITSMEEFGPLNIDGELQKSLESLEKSGIKVFTGEKLVGKTQDRLPAVSDL